MPTLQQRSYWYTCKPVQAECLPAGAAVSKSESESMTAVLLRGLAAVAAAVGKASGSDVEALTACCRSFSRAAVAACRSALASSCTVVKIESLPQTEEERQGIRVMPRGGGEGGFSGLQIGAAFITHSASTAQSRPLAASELCQQQLCTCRQ